MNANAGSDLARALGARMPALRRYARALTGHRSIGDRLAADAGAALLDTDLQDHSAAAVRVALFKALHDLMAADPESALDIRGERATRARYAHLLQELEDFSATDIAVILAIPVTAAKDLIGLGVRPPTPLVRALIVGRNPLVAIDLQAVLTEMGHDIHGVALDSASVPTLLQVSRPGLVLATVSTDAAVSDLEALIGVLAPLEQVPTIFVCDQPEQLLTGNGREPTYVAASPPIPEQVAALVDQALHFANVVT